MIADHDREIRREEIEELRRLSNAANKGRLRFNDFYSQLFGRAAGDYVRKFVLAPAAADPPARPGVAGEAGAGVDDWRPIGTAPRNGTPVLIAEPDVDEWYIYIAENDSDIDGEDEWVSRGDGMLVCTAPTHWMPLPAPPRPTP